MALPTTEESRGLARYLHTLWTARYESRFWKRVWNVFRAHRTRHGRLKSIRLTIEQRSQIVPDRNLLNAPVVRRWS